jgi:hypothetical protein
MPSCVRDAEDYLVPLAPPPRPPAYPLLMGLLIGVGLVAVGLCVAVGRAVLA